MRDFLLEVYTSMINNKMRIALTGFSIGWGMFILIVLLGAGNGLLTGMVKNFSSQGTNAITISPGVTSLQYNGMKSARPVFLKKEDGDILEKKYPNEIKKAYPCYVRAKTMVSHGTHSISVSMKGQVPGYKVIEHDHIVLGRDLDEPDMINSRKVCVINQRAKNILMPDLKDPVGQYVDVDGLAFQVVGISKADVDVVNTMVMNIPLTTAMGIYSPDGHVSSIALETQNLESADANKAFVVKLQQTLSELKSFDPQDHKAVPIRNPYEFFVGIIMVLHTIRIFVWIVGLATLVAGIVGISNIMLITVKERTRELGVRKAMGATNGHIVSLVLAEAVFITMIFGYMGVLAGVGLTQLAAHILASSPGTVFGAPTVNFSVIMAANLIMVIAGLLAGYKPSKHAVDIKLVDSLMGN